MVGCNDKSNIQEGSLIPLEDTPRQANRSIVRSGTSVQACDNYYVSVAKTIPSVIHNINQSRNPVDSLYIGGPDGRGCTFVLLYDATFDPSLVYKHFAHFHQFLLYLAHSRDRGVDTSIEDVESLEYMLLFECNGGLDHNLTFLANQLSFLGIFLVGNMYDINATCRCPGLSYLNMAERPISLLN